ncbi:PPE family protein [Herbihabitans rhizosphaerae]|uniref:PPE family protein n=1 Tax=Herbihabitans rhizosphaerae TaxID=1872711 RepID=A0A4Q7L5G4_9PSEU|nr:PPE domain-containing protein [Herbihabitans rhizosphaerae]RZS44557.1 PPE family protein [Herbihabitans rhizosphaerae]
MTNQQARLDQARYAAMSTEELVTEVTRLSTGPGSQSFHDAVSQLEGLTGHLSRADKTIRDKMRELGVTWTGQASEGSQAVGAQQADYGGSAGHGTTGTARATTGAGESYDRAFNGSPDPNDLAQSTQWRQPEQQTIAPWDDYTQQANAEEAKRQQAIQSLEGYGRDSQTQLDGFRPLPEPPPLNLDSGAVVGGTGSTSVSGWTPTGSGTPTGVSGLGSTTGLPTGGGASHIPTINNPGTPPVAGPPGTPGPGPIVGPGPVPGGGPISNVPGGGLPIRPGMGIDAAQAAALAASGLGGGVVDDEERRARPGSRGPGGAPGVPKPGAVPLGAPDAEEARAARNAERVAPRQAPRAGGLMSPAAMAGAGAGAPGEDDDLEHKDKYGFGDPEMFEDDTLVAPATIGEDDE